MKNSVQAYDIQLFAAPEGAEDISGVQAPDAGGQTTGVNTASDAGEQDRSARFKALIEGEFKDEYNASVQSIVTKRLRGSEEAAKKYKLHPYVAYDLMRDSEWIDAHKYAQPENLYEGEIGEIAGVRFVQTTEAKIYCGADLAGDSRTLSVNNASGYTGSVSAVKFDGGTVAENALAGRYILLNGVRAKVTANTADTLTIEAADFGTVADNSVIYPGEGGADGLAVFGTLILGDGAYGVTEVTGGGLEIIVKQRGSSGAADPLDQRSSVGWKAIKTAEMLIENYLVRIESVSARFSESAKAN